MIEDYQAFAMETVVVPSGNVAASLSSTRYNPASGGLPCRRAYITVNPGAPISYTIDTTTVGSATGHKAASYGQVTLDGYDNIKRFSTTSFSSGTTGSITVTYFR